MKLIFNDATELTVQSADVMDDMLTIKTISATVEELKKKFQDPLATRKIVVKERESILGTYESYENLYSITEYTGGILGVAMRKKESIPEVQKEIQSAMVAIAQIQAQSLTDSQALYVQVIYPDWSGDGVAYSKDYKVRHNDILYKCIQTHTSQSDWAPPDAPSLFAKVLIPDTDTIPEWEQPGSTNPYAKGDKVTHNGKTWISTADGNVWEPGVYGWEEV
jgi:hypothetical protein